MGLQELQKVERYCRKRVISVTPRVKHADQWGSILHTECSKGLV